MNLLSSGFEKFKPVLGLVLSMTMLLGIQSCTKECPPNKEGEDCNIDIVDKFAGTWRGVNDCYVGDTNNINISRINPTQLTITGLFENQLYPLNGTVNFASIEFESGQVLADGVILESASGHLTVEQNLRLYFSYRDETTTELEVVDCRFSGNLLTPNSFEGIPELTTLIVSGLNFSADSSTRIAFSGGIISSSGASTVSKRGICWATTSNPTVDSPNKTEDGIGSGEYTSQLYNLVEGTTYYVRAYAVNSAGTGYGNEVVFSVPECIDDLCIGFTYENGTIAYFLQPGDIGYDPNVVHGLVVSGDIGEFIWGCDGFDLSTSSDFGAGANNTNLILEDECSESSNTAAQAARGYMPTVNDTTWYLPSREDFRNIYNNLASSGLGGFNPVFYWTSSESESSPNQNAWMFNNVTAEQMELLSKYNTANVKAVKKF